MAPIGLLGNDTGAVLSWRCPCRHRRRRLGLVGLLLVLREDLQGLVDLGRQSLRRLEQVEKLSVVHLEEHTWARVRAGRVKRGIHENDVRTKVMGSVAKVRSLGDSTNLNDTPDVVSCQPPAGFCSEWARE